MTAKKIEKKEQVLYNDRWIDRDTFRAFVYKDDEKHLAEDYDEFVERIRTGWSEYPKGHALYMVSQLDSGDKVNSDLQELPEYKEMMNDPLPVPKTRGRKKKQFDIMD